MTTSPSVLALAALLAAFFASLIVTLIRRVRSNGNAADGLDEEWLEEFSVETYRPMERLLQESDYEFMASQPGYHPGIARKLRAEHRRVFRIYLRSLTRDFNRLTYLAKLAIVYSSEDRSDLAQAIFRLRLNFYWNVATVELRLALAPLPLGSIDARRLIASLASVRDNVEHLSLIRQA